MHQTRVLSLLGALLLPALSAMPVHAERNHHDRADWPSPSITQFRTLRAPIGEPMHARTVAGRSPRNNATSARDR